MKILYLFLIVLSCNGAIDTLSSQSSSLNDTNDPQLSLTNISIMYKFQAPSTLSVNDRIFQLTTNRGTLDYQHYIGLHTFSGNIYFEVHGNYIDTGLDVTANTENCIGFTYSCTNSNYYVYVNGFEFTATNTYGTITNLMYFRFQSAGSFIGEESALWTDKRLSKTNFDWISSNNQFYAATVIEPANLRYYYTFSEVIYANTHPGGLTIKNRAPLYPGISISLGAGNGKDSKGVRYP